MSQRKTFIYNPKIVTTADNIEEASKEFDKVRKDAPKVGDYPDRTVVVNHSFVIKGDTINIGDLLAQYGIHNQVNPVQKNDTGLSKKEEKFSPTSFKNT